MTPIEREDGVALLIAMMAVLLMTALGAALVMSSSSETVIAAQFRNGIEARYAAGAMMVRGMNELMPIDDWSPVTGGVVQSSWIDGTPAGSRTLGDGSAIDLTQVVNLANCQKATVCSQADLVDVTADRPWGVNNPLWTLYRYGRLRDMLPRGTVDSLDYVILLVGNGPSPGLLALRAESFGPRGAHAVVEVTLGRAAVSGEKDYNDPPGRRDTVKVLSWREVR